MKILNNAGEKIKQYNTGKRCESYNRAYKEILDARCGGNSLVDTDGSVSAEKLKVIYDRLKEFRAHLYMAEKRQFIGSLGDILETAKLREVLMKLKDLSITSVQLEDIEGDARILYETLSSKTTGLTTNESSFEVGATKVMNFIFPELFVMLDNNVAQAVLNLHRPRFHNFTQYWKTINKCRNELAEWQELEGDTDSLLKLDSEPTTLVRIFDKCAFIMGRLIGKV